MNFNVTNTLIQNLTFLNFIILEQLKNTSIFKLVVKQMGGPSFPKNKAHGVDLWKTSDRNP